MAQNPDPHSAPTPPAPLPVAPLSDRERIACLRLARSETVGPATFRALINRYGGAEAALQALPALARRGGRKAAPRIPTATQAEDEISQAESVGAQILFTIEPGYPRLLALLELPPPLIYVKGDADHLSRPCVALVGSRDASAAGLTLTRQLAAGLGQAGFVIVSGLARGIDGAAHETALTTGTVAVVAGGVDVIYPPEHAKLHAAIGNSACIISDQPPGLRPRGRDFPRRNRLISGLALGVVVIEAAARSGTLITARFAAEQGREVCAVPGHPLDPRAAGTNALLREGATLVRDTDDVLEALRPLLSPQLGFAEMAAARHESLWTTPASPVPQAASEHPAPAPSNEHPSTADEARTRVLTALSPAPCHVDEIARAAHISVSQLQIILLELSLAGRIEQHGGQLVSLRHTGN